MKLTRVRLMELAGVIIKENTAADVVSAIKKKQSSTYSSY